VQRYYQALAQRKLGQSAEAETALRNLLQTANRGMEQGTRGELQNAGERQSPRIRVATAHYIAGLSQLGLGEKEKAKQEFESALQSSPDHLGAKNALANLNSPP
jgi:tetratricopeptide (TPR) repeat protein